MISTDLLAGAKAAIIDDFYDRCMRDVPPNAARLIEEELITASGYRGTIAVEDAVSMGLPRQTVDDLVNRRLLRIETHLGLPHLELTHDVLTARCTGAT